MRPDDQSEHVEHTCEARGTCAPDPTVTVRPAYVTEDDETSLPGGAGDAYDRFIVGHRADLSAAFKSASRWCVRTNRDVFLC